MADRIMCIAEPKMDFDYEEGQQYFKGWYCPECGAYSYDGPIPNPHEEDQYYEYGIKR